ncbi:MAG: hypothetical protein ACJ8AW_31445 [Rhodopila sp.]
MAKAVSGAVQREQQQEVEDRRGDDLLDQIRVQQKAAAAILAKSYNTNDLRTALSAVREGLRAIELMGKFLGHVQAPTVNILVNPSFKLVQVAILSALESHPSAKTDVLRALERLE